MVKASCRLSSEEGRRTVLPVDEREVGEKQVGLRPKRESSSHVESVMLTTYHAVYAIMMSCAHATPIPVVAALRVARRAFACALFVVC